MSCCPIHNDKLRPVSHFACMEVRAYYEEKMHALSLRLMTLPHTSIYNIGNEPSIYHFIYMIDLFIQDVLVIAHVYFFIRRILFHNVHFLPL